MPTLSERSQVVPGAPAINFQGVKKFDMLLPKTIPHIFSHAEHHEGDGGEGTISTYIISNMNPLDGGSLTVKTVMEVYDETTCTYALSLQGDPRYSHLKVTVRFLPGPSADTSTLTWFSDYTPINADTPGPDNIMDLVPLLYQNFAAHVDAHVDQPKQQTNSNSDLAVSSVQKTSGK